MIKYFVFGGSLIVVPIFLRLFSEMPILALSCMFYAGLTGAAFYYYLEIEN
jgi:hypothetical protein